MIKLIHTADLMFDAPLRFKDKDKARTRREEVRRSFIGMLKYADENDVDVLLISGNLFDRRNITKATCDFLKEQFSAHTGLRVFIMPGKLDPYYPDGIYSFGDLGENVFVFRSEEITCFSFTANDGSKVNIFGSAYTSPVFYPAGLDKISCDPDSVNILMWGGDPGAGKDGEDIHDLMITGVDYTALGNCSLAPGVYGEEKMWYVYPGYLDPVSFDCPEKSGFVYFEGYKDSGDLICKHKYVTVSERRFITAVIDVTGSIDGGEISGKVNEYFDKNADVGFENNILRIVLTGDVSPEAEIPAEEIEKAAYSRGLFDFVLENATLPIYNYEYLSSDPTIKGAFFNSYRAALSSSDKDERGRASQAVRIGLSALNGYKIGEGIDG